MFLFLLACCLVVSRGCLKRNHSIHGNIRYNRFICKQDSETCWKDMFRKSLVRLASVCGNGSPTPISLSIYVLRRVFSCIVSLFWRLGLEIIDKRSFRYQTLFYLWFPVKRIQYITEVYTLLLSDLFFYVYKLADWLEFGGRRGRWMWLCWSSWIYRSKFRPAHMRHLTYNLFYAIVSLYGFLTFLFLTSVIVLAHLWRFKRHHSSGSCFYTWLNEAGSCIVVSSFQFRYVQICECLR